MTQAGTPPPATPAPPDDGRVEVTIDGRTIRAPKGRLVLDAAADVGVHIPIYCAHPKMDPVAVCRMCLVQVEKMPKLQPACATYVSEGMVVHTQTPAVAKVREGMLEFLLLNHPLDCPVCDRGGECDLQDFTLRYGPGTSRMPITDKVHFDKAVPLSDKIELDQERCILCWRCVRYYDEITGEKEIVLQQRGVQTSVATFDSRPLRSAFQGNLPEVCPVGALTHRQYRFVARPWDLQRANSICPECSYGCNIHIDSREYEVRRFASRDNPLVDDMWLCDRGRYSAPRWNRTERVRRPARARQRRRPGGQRPAGRRRGGTAAARGARAPRRQRHRGASARRSAPTRRPGCSSGSPARRSAPPTSTTSSTPSPGSRPRSTRSASPRSRSAPRWWCSAAGPSSRRRCSPCGSTRRSASGAPPSTGFPSTPTTPPCRGISGERLVGVIGDEPDRARAAHVATVLAAGNTAVRRLTVTRGVNGRGCKDLGLLPDLLPGYRPAPGAGRSGTEILEATGAGQIRALVLMGTHPWAATAGVALTGALNAAEVVVAIETQPGPVSQAATVLIPGHTHVEKAGTVTNLEGRVQRVRQALPPATTVPTELRVLSMLAAELGCERWPAEVIAVTREIGLTLPAYARRATAGGRCGPRCRADDPGHRRRPQLPDRARLLVGDPDQGGDHRSLPRHRRRLQHLRRAQGRRPHPAPHRPQPGRSDRAPPARRRRGEAPLQGERRPRRPRQAALPRLPGPRRGDGDLRLRGDPAERCPDGRRLPAPLGHHPPQHRAALHPRHHLARGVRDLPRRLVGEQQVLAARGRCAPRRSSSPTRWRSPSR